MAKLSTQFSIPAKVVTARLEHMKRNLNGIHKAIEAKAIQRDLDNKKNKVEDPLLLTWDDWIFTALDVNHQNKIEANEGNKQKPLEQTNLIEKILSTHKNPFNNNKNPFNIQRTSSNVYEKALGTMTINNQIKKRSSHWTDGLKNNEPIPYHLIDELPITVGELATLGGWMYHKNIYRFEDVVIKEVLKSEFKGKIPAYIINLPHLCTYVQTDNSDLVFEGEKVIAVLFARTMLNNDDVLVVTLYTDSGAPNTITLSILEDKSIEECITDFLDKALPDDMDIPDDAKNERILVMRKLINLVIWFSKKEPEVIPHQKDPEVNTYNFKVIEKNKRLFEANSYKTYTLGGITASLFNNVYDELKKAKGGQTPRGGGVTPHLRSAHWQLYWLGKRRLDERGKQVGESWEVVLHGIQLIGGIPKNKV